MVVIHAVADIGQDKSGVLGSILGDCHHVTSEPPTWAAEQF